LLFLYIFYVSSIELADAIPHCQKINEYIAIAVILLNQEKLNKRLRGGRGYNY